MLMRKTIPLATNAFATAAYISSGGRSRLAP